MNTKKEQEFMSKVFDVFSFFNELDLLEIRLNILDEYVDYFVIVESRQTFSGVDKPLYYEENKERFEKWHSKIIHYVMPDFPQDVEHYQKALRSPNVGDGADNWLREFYQKEAPIRALENVCADDDIIFVSDLDEIWNPSIDYKIEDGKVYRPIQTAYPYYLNNRSNQNIGCWTGTRVGTYRTLKHYGCGHFRTEREVQGIPILNGGWHFSWTNKDAKYKAFVYYDVQARFEIMSRERTWKDESELPAYIMNNKEKFVKSGLMLE
jgi:beta-1,4-mannosyl-glycoprotein beta-1,4-N-acetylglucosaminyltransferase